MENITISKEEYSTLKETIKKLQQQVDLLKDKEFLKKLELIYETFISSNESKIIDSNQDIPHLQMKRGAGKNVIRVRDDFDEPLEDFKEYM